MARGLHDCGRKGWKMMDQIETTQLINGGTVALAIAALSLALGQTAFFLLLAAAGLAAYGVALARYLKKKSAKTDKDTSEG